MNHGAHAGHGEVPSIFCDMGDNGPQWQSPLFDVCKIRRKRPLRWGVRKGKNERDILPFCANELFLWHFTLDKKKRHLAICIVVFPCFSIYPGPFLFILTRNSLYSRFASSRLRRITIYRDGILSALPYPCAIGSGFTFNQEKERLASASWECSY